MELRLGPLLRYVDDTRSTVWVETSEPDADVRRITLTLRIPLNTQRGIGVVVLTV
jgi:hypothetical protein